MTTPSAPPSAIDPGLPGLLDELRWRGMLAEHTPGLPARLATGRPIAGYNGFDPSGPSLHVGHLVPVFGLLHLQRHGGRPVALVGGATGMVGDPSGRSSERNLLDRDTLEANVAAIRAQLERFLDFSPGSGGAEMVNNLDWLGRVSMLDFLRDTGKHFTIPYMLAKDSVQKRLAGGLSFTEFSYMLLQAADFEHLYREHGVEMQMGGADQWGNITAGLELIRRIHGGGEAAAEGVAGAAEVEAVRGAAGASGAAGAGPGRAGAGEPAHGLAYPLLTNPSGEKFGKTAEGTSVWLDPAMTSPFAFYQYWLNAADADTGQYLRFFTLFSRDEVEALEAQATARPEARPAQRALAFDLTARVHGVDQARRVVALSEAAYSGEPIRDPAVAAGLYEALGGFEFGPEDLAGGVVGLAVASGLFGSKGEARRAVAQGGLSLGEARVASVEDPVPEPLAGAWLVVRAGKRRFRIGRRRD